MSGPTSSTSTNRRYRGTSRSSRHLSRRRQKKTGRRQRTRRRPPGTRSHWVDGTLWPCWSWDGERELWSGKYKTTGHGSLIVANLQGRITFVSEPVTGNRHDMAKLEGSDVEKILKKAGGVFGDKGFIGTDYITTPIRKPQCRQLLQWEHEWNNQVSSFRAPVERAVATLKTWRILFTDYRRPLRTFKSSFRAAIGLYFFKESFA